jgi:hypothetical protein
MMALMRKMLVAAALCAALTAAAADTAGAHAGYLSASELRRLFPGHFEAVWKSTLNLSLEASADGKLAGRTWFASDKGTWSLHGNILCITFGGWSKAKCGPVKRQGGWFISLMRRDGTPRLKFRRR